MSNTDSFIDEVSEEVRRDRLYRLMRRYGWIPVTLVVLVVVGAAVNEWRKAQARAEAQAFGDAIVTALAMDDAAARRSALLDIEGDGARAALIAMLAADGAAAAADAETVSAALDAVRADPDIPPVYRELADLKYAMLNLGRLDLDAARARLEPLTIPGAPFRLLATEQLALAEVQAGDTETALERLRALLNDDEVTRDLRRRVSQLIVALGGSLDAT
ncbi:hypothetical protein DXV76_11825 [Rhodobacteraceae bacterium CCMM004]|nr:hypothetical protein DXV76_11825 [Rhodobacteraceae bacterium CCMM004]